MHIYSYAGNSTVSNQRNHQCKQHYIDMHAEKQKEKKENQLLI